MNHEDIKELARQIGQPIPALLALSRTNDPFFVGGGAQRRDAEWFLDIWRRFSFGRGIHLRRIHYRIISDKESIACADGKPYRNTIECWENLNSASKFARYLHLVDAASFIDRRNPDPILHATSRPEPVIPTWELDEPGWVLPQISIDLDIDLGLPTPFLRGYDYDLADQRYHLSIWIEKSTMNDVLEPVCRRYGVDLVTGIGFQSITSVITMLRQRAAVHGKPVRIFYISDFDPAGEQMPVATARQIEFWRQEYAPDIEFKLVPLALTREQVIEYRLPRTPIKETDRRRKGFEDRHGEGAVELDALEALHPGELARLVRHAIQPYFDEELDLRLDETRRQTRDLIETEWDELVGDEAKELKEIRAAATAIVQQYQERATDLSQAFETDMAPVKKRLDAVRHAIEEKAGDFDVALPDRPEAAEADVDESGWLLDSSRSYLEQVNCYRRYKGEPSLPTPTPTPTPTPGGAPMDTEVPLSDLPGVMPDIGAQYT